MIGGWSWNGPGIHWWVADWRHNWMVFKTIFLRFYVLPAFAFEAALPGDYSEPVHFSYKDITVRSLFPYVRSMRSFRLNVCSLGHPFARKGCNNRWWVHTTERRFRQNLRADQTHRICAQKCFLGLWIQNVLSVRYRLFLLGWCCLSTQFSWFNDTH